MKRFGPVLLLLATVGTACGVRVNGTLRRQAANAQLAIGSQGSSIAAANGSGTNGDVGGGAGVPGPVGGGVQASSAGGSTGSSGGATTGGTSPSATAPAGGNGGATDVGVTQNSILLGNVSDLSGPVPGLFQGAVTGTLAFINYINSQGGVYGRQLKLDAVDSQTTCAQTENGYTSLVNKVFAFVGSFGLYDDCSAQVLGQHPDIPDAEYKLSPQGVALPNDFSVNPAAPPAATGPLSYFAAKFGDAVQHVGSLWDNIPSAVESATGINAAAESVGWKFVYTRAIGSTETNFTTDVVRMQAAGVKLVFIVGATAQICATVIQEAEQQNWHPVFVMPVAYAQNFVQLVGSPQAAEGVYGYNLYSLFFNATDAHNIPELALYQEWMQRTDPNQPEDLYSMYAWAEGALFVQALRAAGPRATRAGVMTALRNIHSFSDSGVVGPADPADKVGTHCYVLFETQNGAFVRLDTPPSTYRCDGRLFKG